MKARLILQIALPFAVLAACSLVIFTILSGKEEPRSWTPSQTVPEVAALRLEAEDFTIVLQSQGTVRARTESSLIPEVRGRIVGVSPNFQEGAFFEQGEALLSIDDRDYRSELAVAEASYAQAELALLQEKARHDQARRDWDRINPGMPATELTLREPQLRQARANAQSARARVETAKLNLERTRVRAPFAGRVLSKSVDVGQFVSPGNQLARLYAVDYAEVRLPLTASRFAFLELPSIYKGSNPSLKDGPAVVLRASAGGESHSWKGRIVRSEGSIDTRTRQVFVVAQIKEPYEETVPGRPPLKVGAFVQAEIEGMLLEDVFVIPRRLYKENSYVLIVRTDLHLERRRVELVWETDTEIVVRGGLAEGELLCLTDLAYAVEGLRVSAVVQGAPGQAAETIAAARPRPYPLVLLEKLGEKMPPDLREQLEAAVESQDRSQVRPLMREVMQWARESGEELPQRN